MMIHSRLFSKLVGPTIDFRQFMLRQQVLRLYRDILRAIYKVEDANYRRELLTWARSDFEKQRHLEEEMAIKMMISMGRKHLRELESTIGLAR